MYCKNCGRQLKEGMRFCDRCGQSVRKSKQSSQAARHREIEELKAERLNRKKRLAEKEAKQARSKQRKKKKGNAFVFVIIVLLIAVVSVIIGYNIFPKSVGNTVAVTTAPTDSASSLATPVATASAVKSGYSEITVSSITCPYPSSFHANTTSGNEKLNITDALGGANMVVSQEAKSGEPKELMKEYITQIGAEGNPNMHAGSEWYSVTATVDDKVHHRKCIVRNGLAVYYDFTYDASSSSAKKYEEYTDYIDSNFK